MHQNISCKKADVSVEQLNKFFQNLKFNELDRIPPENINF